jgi:hypothetical protein
MDTELRTSPSDQLPTLITGTNMGPDGGNKRKVATSNEARYPVWYNAAAPLQGGSRVANWLMNLPDDY